MFNSNKLVICVVCTCSIERIRMFVLVEKCESPLSSTCTTVHTVVQAKPKLFRVHVEESGDSHLVIDGAFSISLCIELKCANYVGQQLKELAHP